MGQNCNLLLQGTLTDSTCPPPGPVAPFQASGHGNHIITSMSKFYLAPVTKPPIRNNFDIEKPSYHLLVVKEPFTSAPGSPSPHVCIELYNTDHLGGGGPQTKLFPVFSQEILYCFKIT
jgi:hypothetical protein